MNERDGDAPRSRLTEVMARLAPMRWPLLVASVAIIGMGVAAGVAAGVIAAAVLAVLASALLAPRSHTARPDAVLSGAARGGFEALSAQSLADAVPDPMIVIDAEGMIVHANGPARDAFGKLGAGTLLALRFRTPEIQELIGRLLAGVRGPLASEYAERVPVERWFRVAGTPVGDRKGLFVLVFKDQSELRRIDRMRADFIANASHELRTPLASIAGFIETLRGPARNDAKARETFLQIMQSQTSRMARLIDDLLSLSRLEMKPYSTPGEALDLGQLVGGVVDALSHLAAESGVTFEWTRPQAPIEIRGDRDELIQVFENLLENACKYGQSGGRVLVNIEPTGIAADHGPRVTVTDFGPGIPEEHIPRITERFYRVDVETSRAQKGTGLGLAIVKHILTRHNARLSIRSEVGKGAAFTVHFARPR